jgi:trehalose 6-phosphate phosphatase
MRASSSLMSQAAKRLNESRPDELRLDEFFEGFAGATAPLLLLDYDGTLAPFRVDRFKARPWAGVRTLLSRIQNQGKTRMVVVTGRPAAEILPLLAVEPPPEVWGLHGSERLHADGRRELEQVSAAARMRLKALCEQLHKDSFGGLFEEKPNAAAVHWRGVPAAKAKAIEKQTRALFEPLPQMDGLKLLEFEAGLELRTGRDKGEAVKALLEETCDHEPCPAAYLGDDLTDEAAFRAIKGHGLGVLVRRQQRPTAADVWLRPPVELRAFLKRWFQACRGLEIDAFAAQGGLAAGSGEARESNVN